MTQTTNTPPHPNPSAADFLDEVKELLRERGNKYGPAQEHFQRTCSLLQIVFSEEHFKRMADRAVEGSFPITPFEWALIMVCDKLARLSNPRQMGSDDHADTLEDIIGYAALARAIYADYFEEGEGFK